MDNKIYLGDGVYAEFDGYQIKLYTSNGMTESEPIFLEAGVASVLFRFNFADKVFTKNENRMS